MSQKRLSAVMREIKGHDAERSYLLVPDSTAAELSLVEIALGQSLPLALTTILNAWREFGSEALLTILPRVLNSSATPTELDPTGRSMRELFPTFCTMLDNTESFGVILDPVYCREDPNNLIFIGVGEQLIPRRVRNLKNWACFAPKTLIDLAQEEITSDIKLSPQMRQMFLRVNGSFELSPYFARVEWLQKGLLSDLYRDFWTEMESEEPFERLETFVSIFENGSGDEHGFFFNSLSPNGEYTIYDWDHEAVKFSVVAPDFASWLERIMIQGW